MNNVAFKTGKILFSANLDLLRKDAAGMLALNKITQADSKTKDNNYTAASGKKFIEAKNIWSFVYPFQWLWDTFFISAWNPDTKQAVRDVRKFMAAQRPDGFFGHIRYNKGVLTEYFPPPVPLYYDKLPAKGEIISRITQPPNIAYGIWELAKRLPGEERQVFLREMYPKVKLYHEYIYKKMVRNGIMLTIHPWQNGDDNSPKWDSVYDSFYENPEVIKIMRELNKSPLATKETIYQAVVKWLNQNNINYERIDKILIHPSQRPVDNHYDIYLFLLYMYSKWNWDENAILEKSPFRIEDPLNNAILLRSNSSLLEMTKTLRNEVDSQDVKQITEWIDITSKGLNTLWDQEDHCYYARNYITGELIRVGTVSSLIPLFSGLIPAGNAEYMADKIKKMIAKNASHCMIPSTFPDEKNLFDPVRYWRGPVWPIMNALVAEGLIIYGYLEAASIVINDTLELIYLDRVDGGYHEYYRSLKKNSKPMGLGSPKQSWTMAATIHLIDLINDTGMIKPFNE